MFTNKFYSKVYFSTIEKAVQRGWKKARGRERHHIIPQSLGGSNDKSNLVYLSCREHFLCHWLLVKMTEGEYYHKMVYALMGMRAENEHQERYQTIFTARVYEKYRIEHAEYHSKLMKSKNLVPWNKGGVEITDEHRENLRNAALQRAHKSEETITKWKESRAGYTHSEETRQKHSDNNKGEKNPFYGKKHSKETKEKLSKISKTEKSLKASIENLNKITKEHRQKRLLKIIGRKHTEEAKFRISEAFRIKRELKINKSVQLRLF